MCIIQPGLYSSIIFICRVNQLRLPAVRHLIRFHFAKRTETLVAAGERLLKLREEAG